MDCLYFNMFLEVYLLCYWNFLHKKTTTNKYVEKVLFSILILTLSLKRPVLRGGPFKASQKSATVMIG